MQGNLKKKINQTVLTNSQRYHVVSLFTIIRIYAVLRNYTLLHGLFFLMLKVLSNYTIIKCNLSNRNEDKTSNQKLFLHS